MSPSEPKLFVLGVSHHSASMTLREKLYIDPEQLNLLLPAMRERFKFSELLILSTCNRFEVMGVSDGRDLPSAPAMSCYLELQKASGNLQKISEEELIKNLYFLCDQDAITHVYRVASSLDSLIIGETQITGQFKDAVNLAQRSQTLGPLLGRLAQDALATAKKIRSQTEIGQRTISISHAALDLASKVFGNLAEHKILVIGAGEMAQVAAKYIKSYSPAALYIANRTMERAQALAHDLGFGVAHSLDELPQLLLEADIVLSSTAASGYIIDTPLMLKAMKQRRGRPIILLDIALPRDIAPDCAQIDDVYLFDIDDLRQVVDANIEERQKAAEQAQTFVDKSVESFIAWQRTFAVKPILAAFRRYLDDLIKKESQKTLSRDLFKDLSAKQQEAFATLFEAIAKNISNDASRRVIKAPEGHYSDQLAEALQAIFNLNLSSNKGELESLETPKETNQNDESDQKEKRA